MKLKVGLAAVGALLLISAGASADHRQPVCPMTDTGPVGTLCAIPLVARHAPQTVELPPVGQAIILRVLAPDGTVVPFGRNHYGCVNQGRHLGLLTRLRFCKGLRTQITYRSTTGPQRFVVEYR